MHYLLLCTCRTSMDKGCIFHFPFSSKYFSHEDFLVFYNQRLTNVWLHIHVSTRLSFKAVCLGCRTNWDLTIKEATQMRINWSCTRLWRKRRPESSPWKDRSGMKTTVNTITVSSSSNNISIMIVYFSHCSWQRIHGAGVRRERTWVWG